MNIDKNHTILDKELNEWRLKEHHWLLPFLGAALLIILFILWSLLIPKDKDNTDGVGGKGQGFTQGDGRGHGLGGQGDGNTTGKGDGNLPGDKAASPDQLPDKNSDPGNQDSSDNRKADNLPPTTKNDPLQRYSVQQLPPQKKPSKPSDQQADENSGGSDFYGSQVKSSGKILFLVDTSGSMAINNKLGTLKNELRKAVFSGMAPNPKTYQRGGGFVLVEFNSGVKRYPDKKMYRYRSKSLMQDAERAINSLTSVGGTEMRQAWEAVLKIVIEENITTVYFLSDGDSTDYFTADWLLAELKKNHKTKNLCVNCFSIDTRNTEMEKIAEATGGKYYQL